MVCGETTLNFLLKEGSMALIEASFILVLIFLKLKSILNLIKVANV